MNDKPADRDDWPLHEGGQHQYDALGCLSGVTSVERYVESQCCVECGDGGAELDWNLAFGEVQKDGDFERIAPGVEERHGFALQG